MQNNLAFNFKSQVNTQTLVHEPASETGLSHSEAISHGEVLSRSKEISHGENVFKISPDLKSLNDLELHAETIQVAQKEQATTLLLLTYLHEVEIRALHLKRGFSTLWAYVNECLGYSEKCTTERVNAMRLIFSVPQVKKYLENGTLTLSAASQVQRFIRTEEKECSRTLKVEEKAVLVEEILGKSKRDAEKLLLSHSQSPKAHEIKEQLKELSPTESTLKITLDEEIVKMLERVRELKGEISYREVLRLCLKFYLDKKDPLLKKQDLRKNQTIKSSPEAAIEIKEKAAELIKKSAEDLTKEPILEDHILDEEKEKNPTSPGTWNEDSDLKKNAHSRYIPTDIKQKISQRSQGQCEFVDPRTNTRCKCRWGLHIDHIQPFALAGATTFENLRHLCAQHNRYRAEQTFSKKR